MRSWQVRISPVPECTSEKYTIKVERRQGQAKTRNFLELIPRAANDGLILQMSKRGGGQLKGGPFI
jgi:hypothetical protein